MGWTQLITLMLFTNNLIFIHQVQLPNSLGMGALTSSHAIRTIPTFMQGQLWGWKGVSIYCLSPPTHATLRNMVKVVEPREEETRDFKICNVWRKDLRILSSWWFIAFYIEQALGKCAFVNYFRNPLLFMRNVFSGRVILILAQKKRFGKVYRSFYYYSFILFIFLFIFVYYICSIRKIHPDPSFHLTKLNVTTTWEMLTCCHFFLTLLCWMVPLSLCDGHLTEEEIGCALWEPPP